MRGPISPPFQICVRAARIARVPFFCANFTAALHTMAGLTVPSGAFFGEYHGHTCEHLRVLLASLRGASPRQQNPIVFLLGDSSLDSKYWLLDKPRVPAANGVERVLVPPVAVPDVAHWLNVLLEEGKGAGAGADTTPTPHLACINAAVEESTIADRSGGRSLLPQDAFVRDTLTPEDVLVVSLGGNDVALKPSAATVAAFASILSFASDEAIDAGTALGFGQIRSLFRDDIAAYISAVCSRTRPKLVVVAMIYFPHELRGGSWADTSLGLLGYDRNPARLQRLIRAGFRHATSEIRVPGTTVVPMAFFDVLDPSPASTDYVARVEPSVTGGRKMAAAILELVLARYPTAGATQAPGEAASEGGRTAGAEGEAGEAQAAGTRNCGIV
jgi:hypothetical protein